MKSKKKGFTLIELVVVIAILGILAAIAIPKYIDLTDEANEKHDMAILGGLRAATVMKYATNCLSSTLQIDASYTNYWPFEAEVTNSMSEDIEWLHWTTTAPVYDRDDGSWTEGVH